MGVEHWESIQSAGLYSMQAGFIKHVQGGSLQCYPAKVFNCYWTLDDATFSAGDVQSFKLEQRVTLQRW